MTSDGNVSGRSFPVNSQADSSRRRRHGESLGHGLAPVADLTDGSVYFGVAVDSLGSIEANGLTVVVGAPRGQPDTAGFVTASTCGVK